MATLRDNPFGKEVFKYLTAAELREKLKELPPDTMLTCNSVGNLTLFAMDDGVLKYIGFLDFMDGNINLIKDLIN